MKQFATFGAIVALLFAGSVASAADKEPSRMSITGTGTVAAQPDEGYITVGLKTHRETSAQAVRDNSETMTTLFKTLKELSVEKKDIRTVNFTVEQHYKQVKDGGTPEKPFYRTVKDGFIVQNMIRVTVCDLKAFGKVLDAVVQDGANEVSGISFGSSESAAKLKEARAEAIKDALEKAGTLTEGLGVKLGRVVSVAEHGGRYGAEVYAARSVGKLSDSVPVSGGSLSFSVSVSIVWELDQGKEFVGRVKPLLDKIKN